MIAPELLKAPYEMNEEQRAIVSFLFEDGVNQDEEQQPFLKGHVQIMTIYQAKGLEFPVVFVGRLDKPPSSSADEHLDVQHFSSHRSFEPAHRIPLLDR